MSSTAVDFNENQVEAESAPRHDPARAMINSLHIENFRCFPKVDIPSLGRFNLIVGGNGSGKTALLEAIYLPGGKQDLVFQLRAHRGMLQSQQFLGQQMFQIVPTKAGYEELWKDLFYNFSQDSKITISLRGTPQNTRTLKIYYDPNSEVQLVIGFPSKDASPKPEPSSIIPLTFETEALGQLFTSSAVIDPNNPGGGLKISGGRVPPAVVGFLPSVANFNLQRNFSDIDVKNQKPRLLTALREVFPAIQDLSLQTTSVSSDIYCTVDDIPQKIPVGLLSAGIHRYLAILLSIAANENGVILVDEIENGIFYQRLEDAWRGIFKFCDYYKVQLFASTHSVECLRALTPFLKDNPSDFRLLRTEMHEGLHSVRTFTGKDFESALETGVEFR